MENNFQYQLKHHVFIFEMESRDVSFKLFFKSVQQEIQLLKTSLQSIDNVLSYFWELGRRISNIKRAARQDGYHAAELLIATGDEEFDQYRKDVLKIDWYCGYIDEAKKRYYYEDFRDRLEKIAQEKGGLYKTYFEKIRAEKTKMD